MTAPLLDDQTMAALLARRADQAKLTDEDRDRLLTTVFAAARPAPRWPWRSAQALLPLAAVVAVIVVIVAAILGATPLRPNGSSPGATPTLTTNSSQSDPQVLDTAELLAVIDQSRTDNTDETVLAQATLDRATLARMRMPACGSAATCPVGVLSGIEPALLIVEAGPDVRSALAPSTDPITGVLAIRLLGRASLVLLGVVHPPPDGGLTWEATRTATGPALSDDASRTILVDGWLGAAGTNVNLDCLPRLPFLTCDGYQWISADPVTGSVGGTLPIDSIEVEPGAYQEFVSGFQSPSTHNVEPRRGVYLLRVVTNPGCGSNPCRGWRVVGRLDDGTSGPAGSPLSSPSEEPAVQVFGLPDLQAAIDAARADGLDRVVIAQASIDRAALINYSLAICRPQDLCPVGLLSGITPAGTFVLAGPEVMAGLSHTPPPEPITGILALGIHGRSDIELLGVVDPERSGSLVWPATALGVQPGLAGTIDHVIVVDGWLGASRVSCPTSTPGVPGDSPFQGCGNDWLVSAQISSGGPAPSDAIRVQPGAFSDFAPLPGRDQPLAYSLHALYLLRLVADPRASCAADCRGWRMVGRLDDGASGSAASPSPSPSGSAAVHVLSQADLSAMYANTSSASASGIVIADATIGGGVSGPFCATGDPCQFGTIDNRLIVAVWESGLAGRRGLSGLFALRDGAWLLGIVHEGPGDSRTDVVWPASASGISAAAADMKIGELIVVNGWLVRTDGMRWPCPSESAPIPPATPFQGRTDCNGNGYITAQSYQPITPASGMLGPENGLETQQYAYTHFAPNPVISDGKTDPRHALYLLRKVADAPPSCPSCGAAWDVVAALSGDLGP